MFDNKSRLTCEYEWTEGDMRVSCERYAIVSVDGDAYCSKHVGPETNITRYS
jgi:hypothetical protein